MKKILVSACLLGESCRYDGNSKPNEEVKALNERYDLVPFCPEVEGGLPTPREPSELRNGKAIHKNGEDVTSFYRLGAEKAYNLCRYLGIEVAILKEGSPSCGVHQIHNGRFDGKMVSGMGIAASYLKAHGIRVYGEDQIALFLAEEEPKPRPVKASTTPEKPSFRKTEKPKFNKTDARKEESSEASSQAKGKSFRRPEKAGYPKKKSFDKPKGKFAGKGSYKGKPSFKGKSGSYKGKKTYARKGQAKDKAE